MSPGPIQLDQATALTLMLGPNGSSRLVLLVPLEQLVSCTARSPDGGPDRCTFLALGHRSDPGAGTRGSTDDDRALFPRAGIIRVVDFDGVDGRLRHVHFRLGGRRCKSDDRRVSSRRGVRDVGSSLVLDFDAADFERRRSVHVEGRQKWLTTLAAIDLMQRGSRFERGLELGSGWLRTSARARHEAPERKSEGENSCYPST